MMQVSDFLHGYVVMLTRWKCS